MTPLKDIRSGFLDFFGDRDHRIVPSAPLVPADDPTLLFTNAGMVPFKNYFTGAEKPPHPRATSTQKCVRAGGKHNDLDNVGYTARHHTFFEMMGNFSFGDYFKEEAIELAWTLVHKEFGLEKDKLTVTVFSEDDEAAALWKKIAGIPESRIIPISTSDNFWMMGDTGPCGPCSEIFYDHGPDIPGGPPGTPEEDGDRFIEIWNLVFMQYEQQGPDKRIELPKPSIDTGMGLERMAAVLQGVHDNYDVDLFRHLIGASEDLFGVKAEGERQASHRVIADHMRSTSFLIADGVTPSNEGRGYVLRRIMRRAMRHAHHLGAKEPVLWKLTQNLVDEMGEAFSQLERAQPLIEETLRSEEERFQRTLGRGMSILEDALDELPEGEKLPGETAFKLYDTYGFPLDLTQDALRPLGREVDTQGFETAMEKQKETARQSWSGSGDAAPEAVWYGVREEAGATEFLGYGSCDDTGALKAIVAGGERVKNAAAGDEASLVFDRTPFYGESGGQIGDAGEILFDNGARAEVYDTIKRAEDLHVHLVRIVEGEVGEGDAARLVVDQDRRNRTVANHSATHLVHAALRDVLGPHVTQKGSYVGPDRLRFDFSHPRALADEEIDRIEAQVNQVIRQNDASETAEMEPDAAIEAGALALFGEKYGDRVRVLTMGRNLDAADAPYSVELCGGTHVARTGDIQLFKIVSEGAVAAGVRRIEAFTGEAARQYMLEQARLLRRSADALKIAPADLPDRVTALSDEKKKLERQLSEAKKQLALGGGGSAAPGPEDVAGVKLIARVAEGVGGKDLRGMVDEAKSQLGSGIAVLIGVNEGKAAVAVGVTKDLTDRFSAVDLVKVAAEAVGGKGGGGRPDMAQAGGPDGAKAEAALDAVRGALKEKEAA
ncbi:alanine--tRNA ligase [Euryhalocaulis caribicus]|uniref:alanine--tRNA ligase n=1 Tax=Euryhalocaulis caribicus TaxID=1161401 RepID=UPI0003A88703|nr:alanine--tRNA ligase [Euryhalocaulis caribicus]